VNTLSYAHVDVFSSSGYGGNSLPVFHDAAGLTSEAMLLITRELRHFEAIFITPGPTQNTVRARVFDHSRELPFAGHPLIGAAVVLQHRAAPGVGATWTFELADRTCPVRVRHDGTVYSAVMDQGRPSFIHECPRRTEIAQAFGLQLEDLHPRLPPEVVSTGLKYLVIPVVQDRIARARIDRDISSLLEEVGAEFGVLFDPVALEIRHWNNDGIIEDVATGSAAGVVGAYARKHTIEKTSSRFTLAQGRFTGRPSRMEVDVHGSPSDIDRVDVGGPVVVLGDGRLNMLPLSLGHAATVAG
jgi:PhzF family phenazine biosynthesis protein